MVRLIYKNNEFKFEDKFLWFWVDKTAIDKYGNELPYNLSGFKTINEAIGEARSDFYIHSSCLPFINKEDR